VNRGLVASVLLSYYESEEDSTNRDLGELYNEYETRT
jgi:hypothetical protein